MNHEQAVGRIKKMIGKGKRFRFAYEMARELGIYPTVLSDMFTGKRPFTDAVLDIAGLQRVRHPDTYTLKKQESEHDSN